MVTFVKINPEKKKNETRENRLTVYKTLNILPVTVMFKIVLLKIVWEMRNSLQNSSRMKLSGQNRTWFRLFLLVFMYVLSLFFEFKESY